jgi:type II secretion system protein N
MSAELAPTWGPTGARRALAIAAAAFLLTGFFVVLGFPYDRLTPRLEAALASATGAQVSVGRFGVGFTWLAPQLRAWDVDVRWPGGRQLRLDRLRVHPAWSPAWLRGSPALVLALRSPAGELDGTLVAGGAPAFDGTLRRVDLAQLPIAEWAAGASVEGRADAELDVAIGAEGADGSAIIRVAQGSLALPLLPIGVPFDSLDADLVLGGEALVQIDALELAGPLIGVSAKGRVGKAATAMLAPLAIDASLEVRDPSVATLLRGQGVALGPDGKAQIAIGGTLSAPETSAGAPRAAAVGRR